MNIFIHQLISISISNKSREDGIWYIHLYSISISISTSDDFADLFFENSSWKHLRPDYCDIDKNVDIPPPQIDIDIGRYRRFLHISMQISTHYIRGRIISDIRGKLHISRWKPLQPDHIYDINIFEYKYSCHIPSSALPM